MLTKADIEELDALAKTNDALKGPSFLIRSHWNNGYSKLVRGGFVKWGDPPKGFDKKRFAGTTITEKGREALLSS